MSWMVEYLESEQLLTSYGVPFVESCIVWTLGEAQNWAAQQGFPVCLKINSTTLAHRSDIGGVILDIETPAQLSQAFERLTDRLDLQTEGLLLQKMASPGVELIVGVKWDPTFGHVLMLGAGGVLTELLGQVAIRPVDVSHRDVVEMIEQVNRRGLLDGYRHLPPIDRDQLGSLLLGVSRATQENPWIDQMDLNPILGSREGLRTVDVLLIREEARELPATEARFPVHTLEPFFEPRSVAVIGASRNPSKGGHVIVKNLKALSFPGPVAPINPNAEEILGFETYPDLASVPFEIDLAVVIVPKPQMQSAIASCIAKQVKAVTVVTAGYSDTGEEGGLDQESIRKDLNQAGIRLMGPNSIGTISPRAGLATSITTLHPLPPGKVSIVGQTGVLASGLANHIATAEAFGIARIACIGNRGDVDECDVLEFLLEDPQTEVIGMYLEGIHHGTRFMDLLEKAKGKKRVVVVKAGRSEPGARALSSHTGSLAVDDRVFDGICKKFDVIRAVDMEQLMDVVKWYALLPPRSIHTLGALSISGMGCVLTADLATPLGFELPPFSRPTVQSIREVMPPWAPLHNPCDLWSTIELVGPEQAYREVGLAILADEAMDALFLIFLLIDESSFDPGPMLEDLLRHSGGKPIFSAILGGERTVVQQWRTMLERHGIPTYPGIQRALKAASLACAEGCGMSDPGRAGCDG